MDKSGLTVSVIDLGGGWLNGRSQEEATAIFDTALAHAVNSPDVFMAQPDTRPHRPRPQVLSREHPHSGAPVHDF